MSNTAIARKHWDKAFVYFFEGNYRLTIKEGRSALKLNPNLARPHWIIGQAYQAGERPDREAALKEFRELVRREPRWPEGHASLGATLMSQGRFDEALNCVREVLRLKPTHKWAQVEMGKYLLKRMNTVKLLRCCEQNRALHLSTPWRMRSCCSTTFWLGGDNLSRSVAKFGSRSFPLTSPFPLFG